MRSTAFVPTKEHATAFARTISREWRSHRPADAAGRTSGEDLRDVLKDVRTIVTEVIDGVDELIGRVFHGDADDAAGVWLRVVTSRDAACGACGRKIEPGEDCHLRRLPGGREFRCVTCGPPTTAGDATAG